MQSGSTTGTGEQDSIYIIATVSGRLMDTAPSYITIYFQEIHVVTNTVLERYLYSLDWTTGLNFSCFRQISLLSFSSDC